VDSGAKISSYGGYGGHMVYKCTSGTSELSLNPFMLFITVVINMVFNCSIRGNENIAIETVLVILLVIIKYLEHSQTTSHIPQPHTICSHPVMLPPCLDLRNVAVF
jgi:hypothetical protein